MDRKGRNMQSEKTNLNKTSTPTTKKTAYAKKKSKPLTRTSVDELSYAYIPNGENTQPIVFYIPNENASQIDAQRGIPFEEKCDSLMSAALNVRRQNLFSSVDFAQLAKECYSFRRFVVFCG